MNTSRRYIHFGALFIIVLTLAMSGTSLKAQEVTPTPEDSPVVRQIGIPSYPVLMPYLPGLHGFAPVRGTVDSAVRLVWLTGKDGERLAQARISCLWFE
jgi:hypothetical protein